ncbi:MAG: hypothetical protein ACODAU_08665 [Myxococcota bacterium]
MGIAEATKRPRPVGELRERVLREWSEAREEARRWLHRRGLDVLDFDPGPIETRDLVEEMG